MTVVNLTPSHDTCYGSVYLAGPNGSSTYISIGGWGDWYYPYFKFDLSSIPSGATITLARLALYGNGTPTNNCNNQVKRCTSDWLESTLTRASHPTHDATTWATCPKVIGSTYTFTDITTLVQAWFNATYPNYGLTLQPTSNSATNGSVTSKENGSNMPYLEVTYTGGGGGGSTTTKLSLQGIGS